MLTEEALEPDELRDPQAAELRQLAEKKARAGEDLVQHSPGGTREQDGSAERIDWVQLLKRRLGQAESRAGDALPREEALRRRWSSGPSELCTSAPSLQESTDAAR